MANFDLKQMILGKDVRIVLQQSLNQDDKFSKNHVRYDGKLTVDGKSMYFTYQFNPKFTDTELTDILDCLLRDASVYDNSASLGNFYKEYGYDDVDVAIKAYDACKKTSDDLRVLFTESELDALRELSDRCWEEEQKEM